MLVIPTKDGRTTYVNKPASPHENLVYHVATKFHPSSLTIKMGAYQNNYIFKLAVSVDEIVHPGPTSAVE
jgi:hypothetical protein